MRLRIWFHRLREIRIKRFPNERITPPFLHLDASPASPDKFYLQHASSLNFSSDEIFCTPINSARTSGFRVSSPKQECDLASPRLSYSPSSPLPSPALLNTPVRYPALVLKSPADFTSLQNSRMPRKSIRTGRAIPRVVVAALSCDIGCGSYRIKPLASSLRKARENLRYKCSSGSRNLGTDNKMGDYELPASRSKWTGACCMLVDKGLVRTRVVLRKKRQDGSRLTDSSADHSAARSRPWPRLDLVEKTTRARAAALLTTTRDHSSIGNVSLDDNRSNGFIESRNPGSNKGNIALAGTRSDPFPWSKDKPPVASAESFSISIDRGHPADNSLSFSESFGNCQWGFGDIRLGVGKQNSSSVGWQGEDKKLGEAASTSCTIRKKSPRANFVIDSLYPSTDYTHSEGSEKDSLLQEATSAYKTDSDSNQDTNASPHSPWGAAASCSSLDLEANAKAWTKHSLFRSDASNWHSPSTENATTKLPSSSKDFKGSGHMMKSKREDTTATRRKYRKAYGKQSLTGQSMIVLPREISRISPEKDMKPSILQQQQDSKLKELQSTEHGGKIRSNFAVETCSRDPFADFRNSMVDMILEKQINKSAEMEELLQCFLSLNSLEHHDIIVQAFSEVWEKLFGQSVRSSSLSSSR